MSKLDERLRRAAILIASLDDATADRLLDELPAEEAAQVRRAVVELSEVAPVEEREILSEFLKKSPVKKKVERGVELVPALAQRIHNAPPAPTNEGEKPFRFLHHTHGEELVPLIAGEHPQTIAVVVSHLPDDRAATVLASLDAELQADVIQRLIDLDQADPEIVREVERGLESRMLEHVEVERRQETGLESMARIIGAARPAARRTIMSNLTRRDRALAERLHPQRFEFDDLQHVDDTTLASILAAAGSELSRLALAGADDELVERILQPLSPGDAKNMRRMIERQGPMRLSDVEDAQREIAGIARDLALKGTIELPQRTELLAA